ALKRSSAKNVTAVIPYFGYARQDRKDAGRVPITAKLVANLITRAGADRVLAMDLHAAQIQGFFDVPVDHLYAAPVLNNHLQSIDLPADDLIVVSPDVGGIKRAVGHGQRLNAPLAIVDKRRVSADTTTSANIIGASVEGKVALMFDDMISTAGSICSAAEVLHNHGAKQIFAAATHGLLVGPAVERLQAAPLSGIIVTDSIPLAQEKNLPNITVLSVASLLGQAIKRIHRNESVSMMFQ
ncbi:MAG TPA: ribose-phosphate diphosphokinase, partial [Planctomycetaceae bacterium]|nr:ribose-phosphate diphosphokinase [Planctomycetaceae bacterium]